MERCVCVVQIAASSPAVMHCLAENVHKWATINTVRLYNLQLHSYTHVMKYILIICTRNIWVSFLSLSIRLA